MTESQASKNSNRRIPPRPEPFPDMVGRSEVSKGLFGDLFKRKPKAKKSEARGSA